MTHILARHSRTHPGINSGGVVAHGCAVNESKNGEVVHGCTVNGAKDANPVRQIALYSLHPRSPTTTFEDRLRGDDDKNVIWLQTLN